MLLCTHLCANIKPAHLKFKGHKQNVAQQVCTLCMHLSSNFCGAHESFYCVELSSLNSTLTSEQAKSQLSDLEREVNIMMSFCATPAVHLCSIHVHVKGWPIVLQPLCRHL